MTINPPGVGHAFVVGAGTQGPVKTSGRPSAGGGVEPPAPQPVARFASLPGAISCPDSQCGPRIQVSEEPAALPACVGAADRNLLWSGPRLGQAWGTPTLPLTRPRLPERL